MNLRNMKIKKILSEPYMLDDKWFVKVLIFFNGNYSKNELKFNSKQDALSLKIGDFFLS